MTLNVTHTFVSAIPDDPVAAAAGEVLTQSHWNATHTVTGTVGPSIGARTILTANTNYYVTLTGSDSNDGSLAHPWATPQHAINSIASSLDIAAFNVEIHVGVGSFGFASVPTMTGGGLIQITGAGVASTTITATGTGCLNFGFFNSTAFAMTDVTFDGSLVTSAGNGAIGVFAPVSVNIGDVLGTGTNTVNFKSTNPSAKTIMTAQDGGQIFPFAAIGVTGGWANGVNVSVFGLIEDFATWTMTSTPSFNIFCQMSGQGLYVSFGSSFSGAATGQRFNVQSGSVVASGNPAGSMGSNFFPGSTAGFVDGSSSYDGFQGPLPGIDTQTGASYTLAIGDAFNIVEMNNAGANTLTVPTNASVAFEVGTKIWVTQVGAGATTIAGAGGVTVDNAGVVGGQWKSAKLYKRGTDEWVQTNA